MKRLPQSFCIHLPVLMARGRFRPPYSHVSLRRPQAVSIGAWIQLYLQAMVEGGTMTKIRSYVDKYTLRWIDVYLTKDGKIIEIG